jgi:NADP-reducing hydrogenase subunit HndB
MSNRISNPQQLEELRAQSRRKIELRDQPHELRVTLHLGTCGIAAGARDVLGFLIAELGSASAGRVTIRQSGCAGICAQEPMITVTDSGGHEYRYGRLDHAKVKEIVSGHLLGGQPVSRLLIGQ